MWNTKLDTCVRPLDIHLDWCVATEITLGSKKFTTSYVYMPYQCHDNESMYVEKLGILKAVIDELDNTCYAIIGDWNVNLCDIDNSLFVGHMISFCSENKLKILSYTNLPKTHIHMLVKGGIQPLG